MNTPLTIQLDRFDPLALHLRLCPDGPGFLESPGPPSAIGRYSIVPLRRTESYRLGPQGLVRLRDGRSTVIPGDPFESLGQILDERRVPRENEFAFPGGFFGFFGYDLAGWIEQLPHQAERDLPVPALWLDWVDLTAVFDHRDKTLTLATLDPATDLEKVRQKVCAALETPLPALGPIEVPPPQPMIARERFEEMVAIARDYIAAGDIYQANLSCRFDSRFAGDSADLYRRLRGINPSPFCCLLRSPQVEIISSSPERLVSLRGDLADTRPIAGTRPRGFTPPDEERVGKELLAHPKERAEHIMLVDLERNDLGKVCAAGSVEVNELMVLEHYSHVTHIVSNVRGRLRQGLGPFDLLRATFPGGTITGVPKKRCMEIIEELEPTGRGTYTGSAGYISATGDMDLNILIRSFQRCSEHLSFQVGAGIVADSVPAREWEECLAKGLAMRKALEA